MVKKLSVSLFKDSVPSQFVLDVLQDKSALRYSTLQNYLDEQKFSYDPKELLALIRFVNRELYRQVYRLSLLQYAQMSLSQNWGMAGHYQIESSFCRLLLKIPIQEDISPEHLDQFRRKIQTDSAALGIEAVSSESLNSELKQFRFRLFDRQFYIAQHEAITQLIQFIGSIYSLASGTAAQNELRIVFGIGKLARKTGFDVIYMNREVMRTPSTISAMAAMILQGKIVIRIEALRLIFYQKWMRTFQQPASYWGIFNPYWSIADGIIQEVFRRFNVTDINALKKSSVQFIRDIGENVLYHEIGHNLIQMETCPLELVVVAESSRLYSSSRIEAFEESLADCAPHFKGQFGALYNMVRISKKDINRAERLFYIYLSDTWFYNTEDTYMYPYTDTIALIFTRYIRPDKSVDFIQMKQDLSYPTPDSSSLFEYMNTLFIRQAQGILDIVKTATYFVQNIPFPYSKFSDLVKGNFLKNDGHINEKDYKFLSAYWLNMLHYVRVFSDAQFKLEAYFETAHSEVIRGMMDVVLGPEKAHAYNYDPRAYLVDHLTQLGFAPAPELPTSL